MAKNTEAQSGGIGFLGMLTILFIGLKLTGYVSWSWWAVLSPLWAPIAVILAVFLAITAWHLPKIIWAAIKDFRRSRRA